MFFNVLRQQFMLLQALNDFLIERGQLADLLLQGSLDVFLPENPEIVEADEPLRIPLRPLRFDELGQRRPHVLSNRAVNGRFCFAANLTNRPMALRVAHASSKGMRASIVDCILNGKGSTLS
ncbi:MAG: hypothetical protein ACJ8HQ_11900 [Chthoniobacterales bacterium]